jgi:hypothetical protein
VLFLSPAWKSLKDFFLYLKSLQSAFWWIHWNGFRWKNCFTIQKELFILATFTHQITKIKNNFVFWYFKIFFSSHFSRSIFFSLLWLIQMNSRKMCSFCFRLFFFPIKVTSIKTPFNIILLIRLCLYIPWMYANLFMKWSLCHDGFPLSWWLLLNNLMGPSFLKGFRVVGWVVATWCIITIGSNSKAHHWRIAWIGRSKSC